MILILFYVISNHAKNGMVLRLAGSLFVNNLKNFSPFFFKFFFPHISSDMGIWIRPLMIMRIGAFDYHIQAADLNRLLTLRFAMLWIEKELSGENKILKKKVPVKNYEMIGES